MKQTTLFVVVVAFIVLGAFAIVMGARGSHASSVVSETGEVQTVVISARNANYYPQTITVKAGQPVALTLDSSVTGCLRDFTIRQLGIHQLLATPKDVLRFTAPAKGTYSFACSMGMAFGKLVVE